MTIKAGDTILLHCSLENLQKMRAEGYFNIDIDQEDRLLTSYNTQIKKIGRPKDVDREKERNTVLLELLAGEDRDAAARVQRAMMGMVRLSIEGLMDAAQDAFGAEEQ